MAFVRDPRGDILEERGSTHWVRVKRDTRGAVVRLETSQGLSVRCELTGATGERVAVEAAGKRWQMETVRDRAGVRRRECPGGVSMQTARDALGRPTRRTVSVRGQESSTEYRWQPGGVLAAIAGNDGTTTRFERDTSGRLVREESAAAAADDGGRTVGDEHLWHVVGPEGEVRRSLREARSYDADGRLVQRATDDGRRWSYAWRDDDLLAEVLTPGGGQVTFEYDAVGRRVSKSGDGQTRTWTWHGNTPIHEVVDTGSRRPTSSGSLSSYLFDRFTPLAIVRDGQWLTISTDHLGTPVAAFDEEGRALWNIRLGTWGQRISESGDERICPFRLPGQYDDRDTGLYYNRWRYYDPATRGYISPDPLGLRVGLDPYDYVPDPSLWIDPGGLWPEPSDTVPGNLHMVGNTTEPKGPRPGTDIEVDDAGMVKGQSYDPDNGVFPSGKSATVKPAESGLEGTFHQVPEGTKLPDGTAVVADGADVGGPHRAGHHTIYPTRDMPFSEFDAKVRSLESEPKLRVTKHKKTGVITVTPCG